MSLVAFALALSAAGQTARAETGPWTPTADYPLSVDDESCVAYQSYVYCVGGFTGDTYTNNGTQSTDSVFYSGTSSSGGIESWTSTASYPSIVNTSSCVASAGFIYCVGGYTGTRATNASYFAALLPDGGISGWAATTSYPFPVFSQSCVGWGGYIYCVGGYQTGGLPTSLVYFAELSSSGIGAWRASASYPTNVTSQSCVPTGGYLYCIGGITDSKPPVSSSVFSSPLSPSGLAGWSGTTAYPTAIDIESCFPEAGDVYCVGGAPNFEATDAVYYSEASSSGELGQWAIGSAYPSRIGELSCIPIDSNAYCVGGASSASDHSSRVYRAGLTTSSSATTYLVSSPTDSSSSSARSSSMTGSPVSSSLGASYLAVVIILPVVAYVCWASVRRPNAS